MTVRMSGTAGKHGFTVDDAVWAMNHAWYVESKFGDPSAPAQVQPTLWIGPSPIPTVPLLEVVADVIPPRTVVIFHVMAAREDCLARMYDDDTRETL